MSDDRCWCGREYPCLAHRGARAPDRVAVRGSCPLEYGQTETREGRDMSKWTLRQQRTRQLFEGDVQEHTAAMRAVRYVRRHASEFHGAGVEEAVRVLTPLETAISRAFKGFAESAIKRIERGTGLELSGPAEETAHGLTVVGWWYQEKYYLCDAHRLPGAVPVTASHVTATTTCHHCGTRLLG